MQPWTYESQSISQYFQLQPSQMKGRANVGVEYHKRYLYNLVFSKFNFKLPDNWEKNFFRFFLFRWGSIAVIYTKEYGWICSPYSVTKLGLYYTPTQIEVVNHMFTSGKVGIIGLNSEIVKIFDDYGGLDDLVTNYAQQLAQIDKDVNVNLQNANVSIGYYVNNKKEADTIKEAYSDATDGNPLVVTNKRVFDENNGKPFLRDVKNNYIVNDLLVAKRTIINEFLTKIGIPNANLDKRERLISNEVNANNAETECMVTLMKENIDESFKKLNEISDLNLSVSLRFEESEGSANGKDNA